MTLGTVIQTSIKNTIRSIQTLCGGNTVTGIVRTPTECAPVGYDANPIKNMVAVYAKTENSNQPGVIIGYINQGQLASLKPGERRIYSTDAEGNEQAKILWHANGNVEIGGTSGAVNTNNITQWQGLDAAMQSDIVTFINDQLALISTGISDAGGTYTPGTMSVDITGAKATKLLIE